MNPQHMTEDRNDPRLMTVDERALYKAVNGVKLPPQTDEQQRAALRRQAIDYDLSRDDRPMTMNNTNYARPVGMPPETE